MDNEYEALLERYEDAVMRLIMYRVAQEEGKRLLEEAEQLEESGFEVPKELDEKCLKLIREASVAEKKQPLKLLPEENRSETRTRSHPRLRRVGRTALVAVLAAVLLFSVAYAASPAVRAGVLNFFAKVEEFGTTYFFYSGETTPPAPSEAGPLTLKDGMPFEFTYIPDGYEEYSRDVSDWGDLGAEYLWTYYAPNIDDGKNYFEFEVSPITDGAGLFIDTEDATITDVKIHGYDGQLIQKVYASDGKESITYLWFDLENGLEFRYISIGILLDESQKIFDGIVLFNKN